MLNKFSMRSPWLVFVVSLFGCWGAVAPASAQSGSMNGPKFKQAQGALTFVLERLAPGDRFGLVDYSDQVAVWKPKLQDMTPENRRSALNYVRNLRSGGAANIEAALGAGFKLVAGSDRPTSARRI